VLVLTSTDISPK